MRPSYDELRQRQEQKGEVYDKLLTEEGRSDDGNFAEEGNSDFIGHQKQTREATPKYVAEDEARHTGGSDGDAKSDDDLIEPQRNGEIAEEQCEEEAHHRAAHE